MSPRVALAAACGFLAGVLLVLALVIALVIRVSLRPLRAVADTATRVASVPMSQGAVSIAERVPDGQADERTEIGRVGAARAQPTGRVRCPGQVDTLPSESEPVSGRRDFEGPVRECRSQARDLSVEGVHR